jgi:hypothetical protein
LGELADNAVIDDFKKRYRDPQTYDSPREVWEGKKKVKSQLRTPGNQEGRYRTRRRNTLDSEQ